MSMNINDMISPQTRAKVYQVLMIVGLTLGALGTGIGAVAASGFTVPAAVTAAFLTLNAVYAYVAGAFNFVAKANTPTDIADLPGEVMLGELTEQNIRDIQDTIASAPSEDQYQPGGVALTVEEEDEDA